jgi:thiol-disulfide isomerase/thioredoxin
MYGGKRLVLLPLFLIFFVTSLSGSVSASENLPTGEGIVGGISIDVTASNTDITTSGSSDGGRRVVEVYTATWCSNCVQAEQALTDVIDENNVTVLAYHRYFGEVEDPFGTAAGDDYWIERYGTLSYESVGLERAPPSLVFDGAILRTGIRFDDSSLSVAYASILATNMSVKSINNWNSTLAWDGDNSSGTVTWSFEVESSGVEWSHRLLVVEKNANFPQGTNGMTDYPDVIRQIIDLDSDVKSLSLNLPVAWDGDDLSLVLIHDWRVGDDSDTAGASRGLLPAPGMLSSVSSILMASLVISRRNRR